MKISTIVFCLCAATRLAVGAEAVDFNREIRPVLSNKCFHCHGPNEADRKSKLRLDQADGEDGALTPRGNYQIIAPGKPEESELWNRITTDDEYDRMPPEKSHKEPLTEEEVAAFKRWILGGAEYEKFWAFVAPQKSEPVELRNAAWGKSAIDNRVMAKLEREGLEPKGEADKRTLIRRLTFDLTGLPPSLAEIDAFLADESPEAYKALVDRLLAQDSYGEHMTRYWADLVRLGDTNGMHKDFPRDFSTYRDWLIRSFNENLPFDDFIKYQLAGDLYEEPTRDQLVASGFNRLHLIIDKGTALPEESHHKNVLDRVEAFGTAFLGLTVQCAQCHDHKYDPISQKEFFQFYAFFNNFSGAPETEKRPKRGLQEPFINLTTPEQEAELAQLSADREGLRAALAAIAGGQDGSDPVAEENADATEDIQKRIEKINNKEQSLVARLPGAMVMREKDPPRTAHLLDRGAYDAPGEAIDRGTPAFLPPMKPKEGMYSRMDLAEWLVSPEHPLTARVAVNRIWQQFFGVGLVKTSEDFGAQGEWPSHPDLLDDLAVEFVASGWDLKKLVRHIVLSNTYKQSSDATPEEYRKDPENRLLARGSRYRMDAEMIRDQILAVSGQLNPTMYGKSVKPPQPPGLWEMVSMAEPMTYVADTDDSIYRRSLYTYWRRAIPPPQMTILNAPSREFCVARRERTNTPLQALLLMNEQEYFDAAKACAQIALDESDDVTERLGYVYETLTSHEPEAGRLDLMKNALQEFRETYEGDPALTELLTPELEGEAIEVRAEFAAWTMLTHSLLNAEITKVRR